MGAYVADAAIRKMIEAGQAPKKSRVVIFGLTFKENCPDIRNSKVDDIIKQLNKYDIDPIIVDPWASKRDASLVSISIRSNTIANSFINAILMSRWLFSTTLIASAVRIFDTGYVPTSITRLYIALISARLSSSKPETIL